jgi:hypothetical protein
MLKKSLNFKKSVVKKSIVALFGLLFAITLITPPKANAAVVVGVGVGGPHVYVGVGRPDVRPYGYVAPAAYGPAPYVAYAPGYVYPRVVVGLGYGYYYGHRGYGWRR